MYKHILRVALDANAALKQNLTTHLATHVVLLVERYADRGLPNPVPIGGVYSWGDQTVSRCQDLTYLKISRVTLLLIPRGIGLAHIFIAVV